MLLKLDSHKKETILIGDTNCEFKKCKNRNTKNLKLVYSKCQLDQIIKEYTRVAASETESGEQNISRTLLEHFSTSCPKYILETNISKTGMVDHYLVYGSRKINAWRQNKPQQ